MQSVTQKALICCAIAFATTLVARCAPTDAPETSELEKSQTNAQIVAVSVDTDPALEHNQHHNQQNSLQKKKELDYEYLYKFRHVVGDGVKKALDECRQKFKWDRWNCPLKTFKSIIDHGEDTGPMPSNKELGLTRALVSSSIMLSIVRSCSVGINSCSCSSPITMPESMAELYVNHSSNNNYNNKFEWSGCDEVVKLAFKVAKAYLRPSNTDVQSVNEASQRINAHNFEAGRQAVRRTMKRRCKCQGTSGTCQMKVCWTVLPDLSEIGDYLKRQYRLAAKVGASTAKETDANILAKELSKIGTDKLVFADASPDYCYENKQLGINGTLGRYCSRTKIRNGTEVSRSERDSCDRLCTKCGYKIKREVIDKKVQCDCRFKYCCSIECQRCPVAEETFKCVRHS